MEGGRPGQSISLPPAINTTAGHCSVVCVCFIPKKKQTFFIFFLTCYYKFCGPSHHETSKLDFTGVIPNVILLYFLEGQDISLLDDAGRPLLWTTLLKVVGKELTIIIKKEPISFFGS